MNVCKAVGLRISELLTKNNMTLYRLEQKSGIQHGTMMCIINKRNKNVTLKTIIMLANGFDMSLIEFLDSDLFNTDLLDTE